MLLVVSLNLLVQSGFILDFISICFLMSSILNFTIIWSHFLSTIFCLDFISFIFIFTFISQLYAFSLDCQFTCYLFVWIFSFINDLKNPLTFFIEFQESQIFKSLFLCLDRWVLKAISNCYQNNTTSYLQVEKECWLSFLCQSFAMTWKAGI